MRRLALILVLGSTLLVASAAAAPSALNQARLDGTVHYLQEAQQDNGGFGGSGEPSQITSAWTAIALAAAGVNPQDQARPSGTDAFAYLVSHFQDGVEETECAPVACTTTLERELMVANAAGTSPHDFGGVDLAAELLSRARPDGSFPHVPGGQPGVNDTIFAIFALVPIAEEAAQDAVQRAADWVEAVQLEGGGWAFAAGSSGDEVDMTGAAVQALVAAGRAQGDAARDGVEYLRAAQNADGGFPEFPGNPESNVASTAWATQAIWAVGENPEDWLTGSGEETEEPLGYMESLQEPDGHIRWKRSQDLNGVWMTAYVAPAFAGQAWPIPKAPRALKTPSPPQRSGDGGDGVQSGAGAVAGGGGRGAPLFSRPKPQSKGKTPGGARVVGNGNRRPVNHSETRRGENQRQPAGTATTEAEAEASQPPAVVSSAASGEEAGGDSGASSSVPTAAAAGEGAGGSGPGGSPAARALATESGGGKSSGRDVTGALVGTSPGADGDLAFGAPGLHGAGADPSGPPWTALGIGAAVLLLALTGARLERRREWMLPGARA